jgi:LysR family glycine cleavage system transcriptional activator
MLQSPRLLVEISDQRGLDAPTVPGFDPPMQDLPLNALRAFAAVYEAGGVRAAAKSLGVTHSAVSRHVSELEAWLGVALLRERAGAQRLALTPQGEALGRAVAAGMRSLGHAVGAVRESRRANAVAIAASASVAVRWLLPRLARLQTGHPWIDVSIVVEQDIKPLAEQGADLAIRMSAAPAPDTRSELLMDDALYPVASPAYWASLGEPDPDRALARARLLHDRDPAAAWERWLAQNPCPGLDARVGPRFTSTDLVLRAAAEGLGVALARDRLVGGDVVSGALVRPFGSRAAPIGPAYWLVTARGGPRRAAEAAIAEWLLAQAGSAAPGP